MVDTLVRAGLLDHVLVLIDDVDLLEGYSDPSRNGKIQRSVLCDALSQLHSATGVDVLVTARSWYAHSRKDFQELVDLSTADEMTSESLIEIHDRHVELYARQGLPRRFLNHETIRRVAEDSQGKPGVFLQRLKTAFKAWRNEADWGQRDYEWYFDVFRKLYDQYREKCPAAAHALEKSVEEGRSTVDVRLENPFYQTVFNNEFVFQSYYQETTYFMDELTFRVVSARLGRVGKE
jgi:hypothetical protein